MSACRCSVRCEAALLLELQALSDAAESEIASIRHVAIVFLMVRSLRCGLRLCALHIFIQSNGRVQSTLSGAMPHDEEVAAGSFGLSSGTSNVRGRRKGGPSARVRVRAGG